MNKELLTATKETLKRANILVIISMALMYVTTFFFFLNFYNSYLLPDFFENDFFRFLISLFSALAVQVMRFAFGVLGAYDYATGNTKGAKWGLAISGTITAFEIFEGIFSSYQIAEEKAVSLILFIVPIIIFSFAAEIRLLLSFSPDVEKAIIKDEKAEQIEQEKETARGTGKKDKKIRLVNNVAKQLEIELSRKPKLREIAAKTGISQTMVSKYWVK